MGVLIPEMAKYLQVPPLGYPKQSSPTPSLRSSSSNTSNSNRTIFSLSLQEMNMEEEFDIIKTLSEGCFSKVLLVRSHNQKERLALKCIHSEVTSVEEFGRELHYNYYLSPHPNIVTSYNVPFMWDNCYIYPQEYALYGDLSRHLKRDGLGGEDKVKAVANQLVSGVEFIHSFNLVHRDIRAENVLVFRRDFTIVKLGDFGHTLSSGSSIVKSKNEFTCTCYGPSCPPEVCETVLQERYYTHPSEDVWSVAILLITCLTGESPWQSADITDPQYLQWIDFLKRKSLKLPEVMTSFTPRFIRLLKRILEPKVSKRSKISEVSKYLNDEWLLKSNGNRRTSLSLNALERHESNTTTKSGLLLRRQRTYGGSSRRSTRSLKLESELEEKEEPLNQRVGRWVIETTINQSS